MSVLDCIAKLAETGKINARQREEAENTYRGVVGRLYETMPAASAEAHAAIETARIMEEGAKQRRYALVKDAIAYQQGVDRIKEHPNGPLAGYMGLLGRDIWEKGGINVESVAKDYEGRMADAIHKTLEAFGSKLGGLKQDTAGIRDVIREIFGVDTKNPVAKEAGAAWRQGIDKFSTDKAKALGKVFSPAEDWRVPQFWESSRAQKFGRAELIADIDREINSGGLKVHDPDTGEVATAIRQRAIIDGAADKIVTDASLGGTHGGAFKTDMRVFRFAEGEAGASSYLKLMDKYGAGQGGYTQMLEAHVHKVARELGLMQVLGPGWRNTGETLLHEATVAHAKARSERPIPKTFADYFKQQGADLGKRMTIGWLESPAKAEGMWRMMSGQASGVGSELMAGIFAGARGFMTATRLRSAVLTAIPSDSVNWMMAARHVGMDTGKVASRVAQAFLKDSPQAREEASRLGIVAHASMDAAIGTKRFQDQFVGEKVFQRLANFVVRAQGLHAWDAAMKRAFPMEFLGTIAQRSGLSHDQLDEPFKNFLDHYRISPEEWATLSKADHVPVGEAKFLDLDKLTEHNEPLRIKLMSAIYDERQFAYLVEGSARVRATATGAEKAGTLSGEFARSMFLFKNYPMSLLATWGMRAATQGDISSKLALAAQLGLFLTMGGALSMQAKQVLQGKDPRDMKDPWFWGEAALAGGAMGIYGDFFKEAFSRNDTSLTETMLGPLADIPATLQGFTSGARRAAEEGQNVNFGAKLAKFMHTNTPGTWYTQLIANRMILDQIQKSIDRDYAGSFARQQDRARKLTHQGFWWAPGQATPSRGPDFSNVMGRQ
ncbi:MAG: hypothetical protein JO051_06410 [Acidobacteriaceae bacterium]|nr:hypothetical protein [Acidobacteriaceae bacterium]